MQSLTHNLELGIAAVINAGALGVAVFLGQDAHAEVRPAVTIWAEQGEEEPQGLGNYYVQIAIQIRSNSTDSSIQQHALFVDQVHALIKTDTIHTDISGLADVTVQGVRGWSLSQHTREDDSWLDEIRFEAYACLLDLA